MISHANHPRIISLLVREELMLVHYGPIGLIKSPRIDEQGIQGSERSCVRQTML